MSTSTVFSDATDASAAELEVHPYRALSRMAMMALVFGLLSLMGLLIPVLLAFGLLGAGCWLMALRTLRRYPQEYSGRSIAHAGGLLSLLVFVVGASYHSYVYATEVPEGYERISFRVLQPGKQATSVVPESAVDLDGQQVFIGGYIHPDAGLSPVKTFVLVPDMGTCCFGGSPKLTDMIEVTLPGKQRVRYSTRKRKLAGVLKVNPRVKQVNLSKNLRAVVYELKVDEVIR